MSMYEHYLMERRDLRVWRTDNAFLTWKPTDDNGVWIADIYVAPEARRTLVGTHLTDAFVVWLQQNMPSCQRLYGTVDFTANHPELGLMSMLKYGFRVKGRAFNEGTCLMLVKEL